MCSSGIADDLLAAQHEYRLNPLLKRLRAYDVLICDEFGYIPFSTKGAQLLFHFFAERYDRGSVLVTSNLKFARWTEILGNERMTAALLKRLTHCGHVLPVEGESYRLRESLRRQSGEPPTSAIRSEVVYPPSSPDFRQTTGGSVRARK